MRRLTWLLPALSGVAWAVPHVGPHQGHTRVGFTLPGATTVSGQTTTLGRAPRAEQGAPGAPGVTRIQTSLLQPARPAYGP